MSKQLKQIDYYKLIQYTQKILSKTLDFQRQSIFLRTQITKKLIIFKNIFFPKYVHIRRCMTLVSVMTAGVTTSVLFNEQLDLLD